MGEREGGGKWGRDGKRREKFNCRKRKKEYFFFLRLLFVLLV